MIAETPSMRMGAREREHPSASIIRITEDYGASHSNRNFAEDWSQVTPA